MNFHLSAQSLENFSLISYIMETLLAVLLVILANPLTNAALWSEQSPYDMSALVQGQDNQDGLLLANQKCSTPRKRKPNCFAHLAAKAAKDASDAQLAAGAAAARGVQQLLADKAFCAAKAAEASYIGKQQLADQIESELTEGKLVVLKERSRMQTAKTIATDARQGVKQADDEVKTLTELVRKAQESLVNSERVVSGAQKAVTEQQEAVNEAKERVNLLKRQVEFARADFKCTKIAAEKAASAAQEARQRAARDQKIN